MKFSAVALTGLVAFASANPEPVAEPQPDFDLDSIKSLGSQYASDLGGNIKSLAGEGGSKALDALPTQVRTFIDDLPTSLVQSYTKAFDAKVSSLEAQLSTMTDKKAAASISKAIDQASSVVNEVVNTGTSSSDSSSNDDSEDGAMAPTAAIALAGVVGGAALFFNM